MDNSGSGGTLKVPGFGDIALDYEIEGQDRLAHGINEWEQIPAVTARELSMVALMNEITEKPDWHVKIFDEQVVSGWREEAFAFSPLISDKAWAWCLAELRDKAGDFKRNQYVRVLDTGSCICKSDSLVPETLISEFKSGITPLLQDHQRRPGHKIEQHQSPYRDDDQTLNIVDPSLYPLVYGRSLVLVDGGQVATDDVLGSYEYAKLAPVHPDRRVDSKAIQGHTSGRSPGEWSYDIFDRFQAREDDARIPKAPNYFWSFKFQWLPCEVKFIGSQGSTAVQITSYINNLHPKNRSLYKSLEKLISLAIEPWNDCLIKGRESWHQRRFKPRWETRTDRRQYGPVPIRIITYGIEWENLLPEWAPAFCSKARKQVELYRTAKATMEKSPEANPQEQHKAKEIIRKFKMMKIPDKLPELTPDHWDKAEAYLQLPEPGSGDKSVALPPDWKKRVRGLILDKHRARLHFKHPEPGTAFSYHEWKSGTHGARAVIDMYPRPVSRRRKSEDGKPSDSIHIPYTIRLQDTFHREGLQIIIQIGGIELSPRRPKSTRDTWQLGGRMMNEHVVGTAIFAYDVQNVTKHRMTFRQNTNMDPEYYHYFTYGRELNIFDPPAHCYGTMGSDQLAAIAAILGFTDEDIFRPGPGSVTYPLPDQEIGSVSVPQGRLITFPNGLEYRNEPIELIDLTLPGHYRYIMLHLVDPNYRICSTRNVPPQQLDWWGKSVIKILTKKGLPLEIAKQIINQCHGWLTSAREAEEYAQEMRNEYDWMNLARYCLKPQDGFD